MLCLAVITSLIFTACSSDDDNNSEEQETCETCDLDLLGTVISSEYCDNGDGTITITTEGLEQTQDLDGATFEQFILALELAGASCN